MTLNDYQKLAYRTFKQGTHDFNLNHVALGVCGEAGEFADCIKKHTIYKQPLDTVNALEELGDLLWYVSVAAHELGFNLTEVAVVNITKLNKRYPEKYTDTLAQMRLDKDA